MSNIAKRKKSHLDICLDDENFSVESGSTFFEHIHLIPHTLPELSLNQIDSSLTFLKTKVSSPLFISCMTGGTNNGYQYNIDLAKSAQQHNIAFGVGSIRILFRQSELRTQFKLKRYAPDVPYLVNLGAAQLREYSVDKVAELIKDLEADALVIHLNPAQELCQTNGERNFENIRAALIRCIQTLPLPIIVKETGSGLDPAFIQEIMSLGAAYADLAGSGGTNWALVELADHSEKTPVLQETIDAFAQWGTPTALLLAHIQKHAPALCPRILASGGIRTSLDIVKSIIMGAEMAGLALPFIRSVHQGPEVINAHIKTLKDEIKKFMLLLGAKNLSELKQKKYWSNACFDHALNSFSLAVQ